MSVFIELLTYINKHLKICLSLLTSTLKCVLTNVSRVYIVGGGSVNVTRSVNVLNNLWRQMVKSFLTTAVVSTTCAFLVFSFFSFFFLS